MTSSETMEAGGLPLYRQVYFLIRERIGKDWPVGTQLLPEPDLARQFGVSRPTLRHALQIAQKEGLLVRRSGQGTFVDSVSSLTSHKVTGSFAHLLRFDKRVTIEVLPASGRSEQAPGTLESVRGFGLVDPDFIQRKALIEGSPFAYMENFVDRDALRRLDRGRLKRTPLVALLESELRIKTDKVNEEIEAAIASPTLAKFLAIAPGTAVLRVRRLYFAKDRALVNFGICWYRGDRYRFTVELSRTAGGGKQAQQAGG